MSHIGLPPGHLLDACPLEPAPPVESRRDIRQAAKGFEAILLHRMLTEMDRTIPDSGLLDSGFSKQIRGMFRQYMAEELAEQGGLGLAEQIGRQLERFAGAAPEGAGEAADPEASG